MRHPGRALKNVTRHAGMKFRQRSRRGVHRRGGSHSSIRGKQTKHDTGKRQGKEVGNEHRQHLGASLGALHHRMAVERNMSQEGARIPSVRSQEHVSSEAADGVTSEKGRMLWRGVILKTTVDEHLQTGRGSTICPQS